MADDLYKISETNDSQQTHSKILLEILASCHSLTIVNGNLIGDPLDIKMFESTGWILEDNNSSKYDELILTTVTPKKMKHSPSFDELSNSLVSLAMSPEIAIIRRFEFSSKLQRMSVIVSHLAPNLKGAGSSQKNFEIYVKGSPEKLRELSDPRTVPSNFHTVLDRYAKNGYRVLACAYRSLNMNYRQICKSERDHLEKDLTFLGFLIMENRLKDISMKIIDQLQNANIRTVMVTGDNALTAISVARQCHIVNPEVRMYLGDLSETKVNGKFTINWKDFEFSDNVLDIEKFEPGPNAQDRGSSTRKSEIQKEEEEKNVEENFIRSMASDKGLLGTSLRGTSLKAGSHHNTIMKLHQSEKLDDGIQDELNNLNNQSGWYIEDAPPIWKTKDEKFALAITGKAFVYYSEEAEKNKKMKKLFEEVLKRTQIFARMKPEDKATLVNQLRALNDRNLVGMCGDGANDCGALKTADMGVSLSEAEASIAAPFTSKTPNISCIIQILREGRCALTTSFQVFKFMGIYSMIQFCTVTILYSCNSNLSNNQYIYVDMIVIFPIAIFMCYTKPYKYLTKSSPSSSLISLPVLTSVVGQLLIQVGFQIGIFILLNKQDFFIECSTLVPDGSDDDAYFKCYETTTLFLFANFQYFATVIAFSIGKPFRKSFLTNTYFTFYTLLAFWITVIIIVVRWDFFIDIFPLINIHDDWKVYIIVAAGINSVLTLLFEKFVVNKVSEISRKRAMRKIEENN